MSGLILVACDIQYYLYVPVFHISAGLFENFVDICENTTIASVKTIHITNDGSAKKFEQCECSLSGRFLLTIVDVRLQSAVYHSQCSTAELKVNHQKYDCDRMNKTGGSVFNKTVDGILTDAIIKFKTNSAEEDPEMVYLTAKAKGT